MDAAWTREDDIELREQFPKAFIYAVDWLLPHQLITVIIGGHEPQWVDDVIQRVNELDHEMLTVLTGYMIIVARQEMVRD